MKLDYKAPKIVITKFASENIIKTSGGVVGTDVTDNKPSDGYSFVGISLKDWDF